MSNKEIILSGTNWQFRQKGTDTWYPAAVPGCVHTDLFKNKLIPDPFFGLNEKNLQWIEREDWEYRLQFQLKEDLDSCYSSEFCFMGLDTYAEVSLNGFQIISSDNMYHPWKTEVLKLLKKGINHLYILFKSPYNTALKDYNKLSYHLPANNDEGEKRVSPFTRKAPYMYGWDWGPRLLTSGIWKDVKLWLCFHSAIKDVFVNTNNVNEREAILDFECDLQLTGNSTHFLKIEVEGKEVKTIKLNYEGFSKIIESIEIKNPDLWWPRGFGEPNRYIIKVILTENDDVLDSREIKIGIRTTELIQSNDKEGSSFKFRINGKDIFIRGANIIPLEYFPSDINSKNYEELVYNALSVNMNMLRAWGGGIYEDDFFYELCDSHGIMVWQDFMFSCGMYPSDDKFLENVEKEIRYNVKRLKKYSSLVLWCGNNEVQEGYLTWGWKEELGEFHTEAFESYKRLFHDLIPSILEQEDNSRPYWPSSPSPGNIAPPDLSKGDNHYWDLVKNIVPYSAYKENTGRFMSEYGFKSYPEIKAIQTFLSPSDWNVDSEAMEEHQGWETGAELVKKNINWFYPEPQNFHHFIYISQLLQADAVSCAIEAHRKNKPRCMGTLFWQLNDCWPAASWSSIDYFGNWKALHYKLKKTFRDILLSADEDKGTLRIHAVSDLPEEKKVRIYLRIVDFEGNFLAEDNSLQCLEPDSSLLVYEQNINEFLNEQEKRQNALIMRVFDGNHLLFNDLYYFCRPKELELKDPHIAIHLEKKFSKYFLFLKAENLAKGVYLVNEKTDGFFSNNYFDILPGEDKIVVFEPRKSVSCKLWDFRYMSLWDCLASD